VGSNLDAFVKSRLLYFFLDSLLRGNDRYGSNTLIERKPRMPQLRGIEGEAVVVYCEPLITKEMGYHRLSRRVNKIEIKKQNSYITDGRDNELPRSKLRGI